MGKIKKWATKLESLHRNLENIPSGEGWFTAQEFKAETGLGHNKSYRLLNKGLQLGEIEIHRGSEYSDKQRQIVRRIWYRIIKPDSD